MSASVRTAAVLVFAAASAAAAWQVRPEKADIASSIAVDSAGDVFAAIGIPSRRHGEAAAVVKLSHKDGAQLWRRRLRAGGNERSDFIYDMRAASNGDVVAAGSLDDNGHPVFFVAARGPRRPPALAQCRPRPRDAQLRRVGRSDRRMRPVTWSRRVRSRAP
jgi:hypothetical protein